jgi:hypothetical protein
MFELHPGQKVTLTGINREHYHGVVDERTDDATSVWVFTIESGRKLFHVSDGFEATPIA